MNCGSSTSSIMAGSAPVFRFDGTQTRVWVDDSVRCAGGPIAGDPGDGRRPTKPDLWRGRSNLYSRIGVYLGFTTGNDRQEPINDFAHWSETPTEQREAGTALTTNPVWETTDPAKHCWPKLTIPRVCSS